MQQTSFELGIYTLGDMLPDPHSSEMVTMQQRMEEVLEIAKLADQAGLDIFGVGEHHRLDYVLSSPPVFLAGVSQVTKRIRLTSATTVLSTVDPVRLFEDFATLDLLSNGRAEIMMGRGAFTEPFPLFGYDVEDNDRLFGEKLDLFMKLSQQKKITWQGEYRSPIQDAEISPRPIQKRLPVWIGVGGTLETAARAGRMGTGMIMAILGGDPKRFKALVDRYYEEGGKAGFAHNDLKLGVTGHVYISDTWERAKEEFFPYYANYCKHTSQSISKDQFEQMLGLEEALFVGSPEHIVEKILYQHELFGHQRFMAQLDLGGLPLRKVAKSIELFATKVAPKVREVLIDV